MCVFLDHKMSLRYLNINDLLNGGVGGIIKLLGLCEKLKSIYFLVGSQAENTLWPESFHETSAQLNSAHFKDIQPHTDIHFFFFREESLRLTYKNTSKASAKHFKAKINYPTDFILILCHRSDSWQLILLNYDRLSNTSLLIDHSGQFSSVFYGTQECDLHSFSVVCSSTVHIIHAFSLVYCSVIF